MRKATLLILLLFCALSYSQTVFIDKTEVDLTTSPFIEVGYNNLQGVQIKYSVNNTTKQGRLKADDGSKHIYSSVITAINYLKTIYQLKVITFTPDADGNIKAFIEITGYKSPTD